MPEKKVSPPTPSSPEEGEISEAGREVLSELSQAIKSADAKKVAHALEILQRRVYEAAGVLQPKEDARGSYRPSERDIAITARDVLAGKDTLLPLRTGTAGERIYIDRWSERTGQLKRTDKLRLLYSPPGGEYGWDLWRGFIKLFGQEEVELL